MGIRETAAGVLTVLALAGGIWRSVQLWRNSAAALDGWPEPILRSLPILMATSVILLAGGGVLWLMEERSVSGRGAVGTLVTVAVISGFVLTVRVGLRGTPVWLVAPHLREENQRHARRP